MGQLALSSLSLSHFRSHKGLRLDLDPRPVAVFGPNGAGKTNLLEAVSLLSPGRGLRRAAAEELGRRPEALGWRIGALIAGPEGPHEVDVRAEAGAARSVRIDGKAAAQNALARLVRVVWLVPSMDRLWIEGAEGRRRFLDRMTMSFVPDHAEAVLAYEKAMRQRNRLLKDEVRDPHWYGALERQMAEAGAAMTLYRHDALARVRAAQAAAETAFPVADLTLEDDSPADPAELAEAFAVGRARDVGAGRTLTGPHRADLGAVFAAKGVPAAQASTGEQKALLISLILANARALADETGAPPLVLLDEVAAHLDAGRRAALYDEIGALGAQAWMTGTGPELFDTLGDRAQYLEVTEEAGESRVGRVE
ncbi:DNA replication/repair protein RecF [Mesobaculum littorinae]|uniref:DNA replication and repair protein RecF n=1 Tax=Mesobaculum littorinae TaxID=2486419 RepID=A0A438AGU9_9RHOB|nr:DNA replication/repair protein RecF [Mesobaculum littorinae]RVV97941.1 DNA replication/repair protein RecF [Mesobaculum littorinae]